MRINSFILSSLMFLSTPCLLFATDKLETSKINQKKGTRDVAQSKIKKIVTLKNTFCSGLVNIEENKSLELEVIGTTKSLLVSADVDGYTNTKTVLMDACKNRKPIDISYEDETQKVTAVKYADTNKN